MTVVWPLCQPCSCCCCCFKALLRRLEQRLEARGAASDGVQSLLHQLSPSAPAGRKLDRYPVRVMLCAYMIKEHPEVVFSKVVGDLADDGEVPRGGGGGRVVQAGA